MLGGPAGAVIGIELGSMGGGAAGNALDGSRAEQVKVGDNRLDVGRSAAQSAKQWLEAALGAISTGIAAACLDPLQKWLTETQHDLEEFENFLSARQRSLEGEIGA